MILTATVVRIRDLEIEWAPGGSNPEPADQKALVDSPPREGIGDLKRHDVLLEQVTFEELRVGRDDGLPLLPGTAWGEALPVVLRQHPDHHPGRIRNTGRPEDPLHQSSTQVVRIGEQDSRLSAK
ncbi:hypothetical protein [Pseudonocardia sp. KRD291]|uniref:hypothetical protein n=1 Tax=Pseudonocardia sp. KRD291 TaxID=2792007 RepID=UPI001CF772CB|nr:hypothetical protein [Pseudonocardia sp. KRD291]